MNNTDKNWLEWLMFSISLLLVLGVVGVLIYNQATRSDAPADIVVELGTPIQGTTGFRVPVKVLKQGDRTATDLAVEITLSANGEEEQKELSFAFLPQDTSSDGWVMFEDDPTQGELSATIIGYEEP